MVVPGMFDMPTVMAESGLTEDDVLNLGFEADGLAFMVVVPELGACRVPEVALSHFMAGDDEYTADGMPEHWSNRPSGPWTIKRDRLRILADSWEKHFDQCHRRHDAKDQPQASPAIAENPSGEPDSIEPRTAATGPKFSMTRAVLIDAHEHEWPTIRADIKDAAANGLVAAKAGTRGWHEDIAMDWAKAKGRLTNTGKPVHALTQGINSMANLPSKRHTLDG